METWLSGVACMLVVTILDAVCQTSMQQIKRSLRPGPRDTYIHSLGSKIRLLQAIAITYTTNLYI